MADCYRMLLEGVVWIRGVHDTFFLDRYIEIWKNPYRYIVRYFDISSDISIYRPILREVYDSNFES